MSEVAFAKTFLATLDKRPIKLASDHVSDPKKYPNESPYVLPKPSHPFPRHGQTSEQASSTQTVAISLKPMRSGSVVTLRDISVDTSIHELKTQYAAHVGLGLDKIKILLNKKPAADLKTLKDLGVEGDTELSVMLMGGIQTPTTSPSPAVEKNEAAATSSADRMEIDPKAPAPSREKAQAEAEQQNVATIDSATETLQTEEFWDDLKGFLAQRLRDEEQAAQLARIFRTAADKR